VFHLWASPPRHIYDGYIKLGWLSITEAAMLATQYSFKFHGCLLEREILTRQITDGPEVARGLLMCEIQCHNPPPL